MRSRIAHMIATAVLAPASAYAADALPIDASHTAVIFSWSHHEFSHPVARLEKVEGSVLLDASDITKSSVSVTMPLDGLRTGNDFLDRRLRGPEFFDIRAYPQITFSSTRIEAPTAGALRITGDLTVHGITRSVVLDARVNKIRALPEGKPAAGFDADVLLRRSDFGVGKYVPMISDELTVHITLEARQD